MARNPYAKPNQVLAITDANWTALKGKVEAFLRANSDKQELDDAVVRAQDPQLTDNRTWNQLKTEMGL